MDRTKAILICLSCILWGCTHRSNDFYQRAINYVIPLVDSGYIVDDYIHLYELATNDSNSVYEISGMNSPFSRPEYPSKIIREKGKYFCFTELDEPELSAKQVYKLTNQYNATFESSNLDFWLLGISKYKKDRVLIKDSTVRVRLIEYSDLWPYLSGGKPNDNALFMCLSSHNLVLSRSDTLIPDSLIFYIQEVSGEIDIYNRTDSAFVFFPDNQGRTYTVVNGIDTLELFIQESFPVEVAPHDSQTLHYVSKKNKSFFQNLSTNHTWDALYRLFSDSTFCFLKANGENVSIRLLHNDFRISSKIMDDSGKVLDELWNERVFNKEERLQRFFSY